MLLSTFYPPNCSFVHVCLCSHFGCTNVCFFFCFLSYLPIFLFDFFECDVILRGFGFSLPTTATAAAAAVDVLMLTLSLTLLHTSGLQYNMAPALFPHPHLHPKSLFHLFFIPVALSFSPSRSFLFFFPSLSLIAPGRVERAPCHLR